MLQDKDRIFNNIYGMFDRSLQGAMARGQRLYDHRQTDGRHARRRCVYG